jgi:hypothetical protein
MVINFKQAMTCKAYKKRNLWMTKEEVKNNKFIQKEIIAPDVHMTCPVSCLPQVHLSPGSDSELSVSY